MKYEARQRGYKVLGKYHPDEVLAFTGPDAQEVYFSDHWVKMTSLRYQTFQKSLVCKCCGLKGTIMLLELPSNGGDICRPHFNLYAEREGGLVQMTKDHINPKSKNGPDHINNMQTLCARCNELKGNHASKLNRLREIQDGVQTVYTVIYPSDEGIRSMEGFATSDKGLAEIVRRYVVEETQWGKDNFVIQVSIRKKLVTVQHEVGGPTIFGIKPLRRI